LELFLELSGDWLNGAELFQRLLSEADGPLLDQLCAADCCCAWAALLLASAGVLLSTRPAKMSLPGDCSGVDRRGGALGYDTLVAASDVTFCTDGLSR
jgi:hypothetical protein